MIRRDLAVLAAIALAAAAAPAPAQPGMGLIGRHQISDAVDHDTIRIIRNEQYVTILLCVDDAPLRVQDLVVRFKNGTAQTVRLRSLIAAGRCSREIALNGRREIAGVDIAYQPASLGGGRAALELFGR